MELLTYSEAAALTGLTNKTLQRHVKKGLLQAVETPVGKRISLQALAPYLVLRKGTSGGLQGREEASESLRKDTRQGLEGTEEASDSDVIWSQEAAPRTGTDKKAQQSTKLLGQVRDENVNRAHPDTQRPGVEGPPRDSEAYNDLLVPLTAHLAALDLAKTQLEHFQRQAEESQRQVLAAERAKISLEVQLGQYQRVLAEQAESLAEERARRLALEAKVAEPVASLQELKMDRVTPQQRGWGQRVKSWLRWDRTG